MSDQQNDWWANSDTPAPPPPATPPVPDADATVVLRAQQPAAPSPDFGNAAPPQQPIPPAQPPQYAQAPPPTQAPPQAHNAAPPQYGAPGPQPGYQQPAQPAYGTPQFVTPGAPTSKYRSPGGAITMIGGALLAIIGTFLPWVTFFGDSVNGYETYFIGERRDALEWTNPGAFVAVTMVLVVLAAIVVLAAGRSIATWLISLLMAGLAGLTTLAALGAVGSVLDDGFSASQFGIGIGIVLCLIGAVIAGVGSIIVAAKRS